MSHTARMLIDDARTLRVQADRLRDILSLINGLDPRRADADTRRAIREIRDMMDGHVAMSDRLKFVAVQMQAPSERERVAKLDEVLTEYLEDQADRVARGG